MSLDWGNATVFTAYSDFIAPDAGYIIVNPVAYSLYGQNAFNHSVGFWINGFGVILNGDEIIFPIAKDDVFHWNSVGKCIFIPYFVS